jgi:hypothetical protein
MIDRAELLALLAARFRRVRGLRDREDAKHQRGYSKKSGRHDALLGCCKNPIKPLDRCGFRFRARMHSRGQRGVIAASKEIFRRMRHLADAPSRPLEPFLLPLVYAEQQC